MKDTLGGAVAEWLGQLGYPAASLATPMDAAVGMWWSYLTTEAKFYVREERDQNGRPVKVPVRSCTPADMVCADMASLIYNERAQISVPEDERADGWLQGWLGRTAWHDRAPLAIERMCGTGTAAWALHIRGVQEIGRSSALSVEPIRYDARSIVPLSWEVDRCTDCAFVADVWLRGERCTQVEVHRPQDNGDYEIMCAFFGEDGDRIEPPGYLDGDRSVATRQKSPTFSLIRLAKDNRIWDYSPMGVALFSDAIGALETVDLAFDMIGNDLVLGRKMLALPESMMHRDADGSLHLPMLEGQQFFLGLRDANVYDGKLGVYEYNPDLRADDDRQMLATALQMLGKRVGFGMKCYALDSQGGITTAKQVASDNAEMMRTVRRHEHLIRPAIASLMAAACGIYRGLSSEGRGLPDIAGQVSVELGDSIMQDDDSLRERDRADVAAVLLEPWKYMVRWQGYTEEEAKAAQGMDEGMRDVPLEA